MATTFNRMTIVAAAEWIAQRLYEHKHIDALDLQWGIDTTGSVKNRALMFARKAIDENPKVMTEKGEVALDRAVVETALSCGRNYDNQESIWIKFVTGLRFDGYEIRRGCNLVKMLPEDIPELDFREAESEVQQLLNHFNFSVAKGHLDQAVSAFGRGDWAAANGQLRAFYEGYLSEIADRLGYQGREDSKLKRDFLGGLNPPFLFENYNEWNQNQQKPQFVQGLMSRMHPHGSHPGLSEEEDATFRLQISLITARLFLRRFEKRMAAR